MAVINGNTLLLYADGKPLEVAQGHIILPDLEAGQSCLIESSEQSFTFQGLHIFEDFYKNPENVKRAVWRRIQNMPRKKKKRIMTLIKERLYHECNCKMI